MTRLRNARSRRITLDWELRRTILERRASYGGRKGRRAAQRLAPMERFIAMELP